jgi:hypothetical protein
MIEPETRGEKWALYLAAQTRRHGWVPVATCLMGVVFAVLALLSRDPRLLLYSVAWFFATYVDFEHRQFARLIEKRDHRIAALTQEESPEAVN